MTANTQYKKIRATKDGFFGKFGGSFIPDILKERFDAFAENFQGIINDKNFEKKIIYYLNDYIGRPSPLYYAQRLSEHIGSKIYLKREDLNHTRAHKINNSIGQILLAKKMSYTEIIAWAGQHGVASATVAALFGMKCKIFMGKTDTTDKC